MVEIKKKSRSHSYSYSDFNFVLIKEEILVIKEFCFGNKSYVQNCILKKKNTCLPHKKECLPAEDLFKNRIANIMIRKQKLVQLMFSLYE